MSSEKVKCLALTNGQIVIGQLKNVNGNYTVKNPSLLGMNPPQRPGDSPQLAMADFLPLSEQKEVVLNERHVMYEFEPAAEIANAWRQMHGVAGLVLPQAGLIKPR